MSKRDRKQLAKAFGFKAAASLKGYKIGGKGKLSKKLSKKHRKTIARLFGFIDDVDGEDSDEEAVEKL